jgi:pimeloyl-ACP methyl ester carboxylesterase
MKININGIEMAYEILGQTGYPLVLIHGFGLNRTIWLEMASKYLRNFRVILPDMRGHGESEVPQAAYPMPSMAQDLAHLLDFLGMNKAVICGHSMGGYVTLAFAAKYPERLAGMGLITTRSNADSEEKRQGRYQMVEEVYKRGSIAAAESLAPRLTDDEKIIRVAHDMIAETSPDGIVGALMGMAERSDRTGLLATIEVPALVVAGEKDQIINLDKAEEMADALPNGKFLALSDAGHMPMMETPEALGEGLNGLIRQVKDMD